MSLSIKSLNNDFYDFVSLNEKEDVYRLKLAISKKEFVFPVDFALTQIACRKSTKRKLSDFLIHKRFLFPDIISSEQASNQTVAKYHACIIGENQNVLDLTAGLGIDALTIAANGNNVTAFEIDNQKAETLKHNIKVLKLNNIICYNKDCIEYLKTTDKDADVIFIDPARRNEVKARTYAFKDCRPDIIENFELLEKSAKRIFIKASPLMDVESVLKELRHVKRIHIICVAGECKEVLIECERNYTNECKIIALDLTNESKIISKWECNVREFGNVTYTADKQCVVDCQYIYDVNAGLHKLNVSGELCKRFSGLKKLGTNTELYCSNELYKDFPGRIFLITDIPDKKRLKEIEGSNYSVISRNYVLNAQQLEKKLKLRQSNEGKFIIASRVGNKKEPLILVCRQVEKEFLD